jgi:hypothetical protein
LRSSLFFRRSWWETHRFAHTTCGEDALFAQAAHEAISPVPRGEYIAFWDDNDYYPLMALMVFGTTIKSGNGR